MSSEPERRIAAPPIHPLAALAVIALDGVLGAVEILNPISLLLTSLGLGVLGFLSTLFVQRFLDKEDWGASAAKGLVMGIVAGVPYPVVGTAVGVPLLTWAGLHQWVRLPTGGNNRLIDEASQTRPLLDNRSKDNEQQ